MADPMTQKPRRLWRILFAVSLALNVAVVGLVLGLGARDRLGGQGPRGFDLALGPVGQVLLAEDRRAIGKALRNDPRLRGLGRDGTRAFRDDFTAALRAQPFSETELEQVLEQGQARVMRVQNAARQALVARISQMSDADRAALATRVEEQPLRRPRR